MATANPPYAMSRNGKPINIGDQVSIVGVVTAISGTGPGANVTVQCSGALEGATDPTQNAYTYSIGVPLGGGTNAPSTGVYGADLANAQTL
jgi:hypothetical protein